MKAYFKNFPKISYPYVDTNGNTIESDTPDMSIRFKIIENVMKDPTAYYNYYWKDEDRVDIVADKYYGDPTLSWVVMLSAEVFDWLYDLPMTEITFDEYLKSKYNVQDSNQLRNITHHYKDISGTIIDIHTYNVLTDINKDIVTIYDYELKLNEDKRNIKLISKANMKSILNEFDVKIQEIKNNRRLFKQG